MPVRMLHTIFLIGRYTTSIPTDPPPHTHSHYNRHKNKHVPYSDIHTSIDSRYQATRGNNKILRTPPPHIVIGSAEDILPRLTLAQLRTNKSYLHKVYTKSHPSPLFPLCNTHHLFNCTHIHSTLSPLDLVTDPAGVISWLVDQKWDDRTPTPPHN